jgi:hypothetical protein
MNNVARFPDFFDRRAAMFRLACIPHPLLPHDAFSAHAFPPYPHPAPS